MVHFHHLYYLPLPHAIECGGDDSPCECKVIAKAYISRVLDLLEEWFPNLKIYNATKVFRIISFIINSTILYTNAQLWLWCFIEYFCIEGSIFFIEYDLEVELWDFVNIIHISYMGLKVHQVR